MCRPGNGHRRHITRGRAVLPAERGPRAEGVRRSSTTCTRHSARAGRFTWRPARPASLTRRSRSGRGCARWRSTSWCSSTCRWSGAGCCCPTSPGAGVSAGFIHSCLARAASMAAGILKLIKTLIIASRVVGFDETTLRSGAAGEKKFVHGAFTERYSLFHLGARSLDTMKDFGILAGFAGIAVTDRYGNYFHATWKNISGHQACTAHILRDLQDCAETYPGKHLARPGARSPPHADPRPQPGQRRRPGRDPRRHPRAAGAAVPPRHHRRAGRRAPRSPAPGTARNSTPGGTCSSSAATAKPTS